MTDPNIPTPPTFWTRLMQNDSARRGLATAAAGIVIAAVTELVWPSS